METPDRTLVAVSAALSAGAGLIHVGLAPSHVDHHWSMGAVFFVVGWAQLVWAVAVWFRADRRLLVAGAALQGAALVGLFAATSVGWPFGPSAWEREAMSAAAWICGGLELAALATTGALLIGRVSLPRLALPVALVAVVAASSAALAVDPGHGGVDGHHAVAAGAISAQADHGDVPGDGHAPEEHESAAEHEGAATHDGAGEQADAGAVDAAAAASSGDGHGHGPVDTTPPTEAQRAAADKLLRETRAALKKYELLSVAEAEGYKVTHDAGGRLFHYGHPGYRNDGKTLDPQRIESLLYVTIPGGGTLLVGGMYTMPLGEKGPNIGGSLTQWHGHDDLCIDPAQGLAISQPPGGGCPPGSAVGPTGEMMHVWSIEYPGGPFGELDAAALREAVLDVYGMGTQPATT